MSFDTYITRLRNGGWTPSEIIAQQVESGCSDCGARLCLDREIEVRVCAACQAVSIAEDAAEWRMLFWCVL